MTLGRVGAAISRNIAARVGDPELVTNLPVVVMADLVIHDSRRPVEIQRLTGLTSGGVTKLLDRLESHDVISRTHGLDPHDRRAITVALTPEGHRVAGLLSEAVLDDLESIRTELRRLAEEADALAAARRSAPDD
jgi:DNA-binding MarR family transcriptional regulator